MLCNTEKLGANVAIGPLWLTFLFGDLSCCSSLAGDSAEDGRRLLFLAAGGGVAAMGSLWLEGTSNWEILDVEPKSAPRPAWWENYDRVGT
jgi:hypothetical protein